MLRKGTLQNSTQSILVHVNEIAILYFGYFLLLASKPSKPQGK